MLNLVLQQTLLKSRTKIKINSLVNGTTNFEIHFSKNYN